jgi:hypothetical protein
VGDGFDDTSSSDDEEDLKASFSSLTSKNSYTLKGETVLDLLRDDSPPKHAPKKLNSHDPKKINSHDEDEQSEDEDEMSRGGWGGGWKDTSRDGSMLRESGISLHMHESHNRASFASAGEGDQSLARSFDSRAGSQSHAEGFKGAGATSLRTSSAGM